MDISLEISRAIGIGTPIIAIRSPDQNATYRTLVSKINSKFPIILWDCNNGIQGANKTGVEAITRFVTARVQAGAGTVQVPKDASQVKLLCAALKKFENLLITAADVADNAPTPKGESSPQDDLILICINAHRHLTVPEQIQGLLNLRDRYAKIGSTLILLSPDFKFPAEVAQDIYVIDEDLPTPEEIKARVSELYTAQKVEHDKTDNIIETAAQAFRGLSIFAIDQAASLAVQKKNNKFTVAPGDLWKRKREMINAVPGLAMKSWDTTLNDVGGLAAMKSFFENLFGGPNPPWVIVFIDEIEKALAGGSSDRGDTSGVTQDAIKMLLICMQDYKWRGQICVGPPGTAKTFFAECLAATYKRPFIALDLGAAKGGIVGQSEQRIRDVMRTLLAIGGIGGCYFVATCNKLNVISPEMKRRFSYPGAPIFFDLPDQEERVSIGKLQTKIYQLEDDPELWASLHGYSGANIGTICALSRDLRMPMRKAAGTVISALETDPDGIAELRTLASGKFRSASYEGPYQGPRDEIKSNPLETGRKFKDMN